LQDPSSDASALDTTNTFDSGIIDTAEPQIIVQTGIWSVSNPELISDTCNIENFQEIDTMVPSQFVIEESYATSFQTDTTSCTINPNSSFECDVTNLEESTMGGTATMKIETTMKGKIRSSSEIDLGFDVIIKSCEGIGCIPVELALTFPCPVILNAAGSL
tara:strand:- start:52 stop:534 length:483 start_codon:yes stop_codon:yes gene_type:complete